MDHQADLNATLTHHDVIRLEAEARRLRAVAMRDMMRAGWTGLRGLFAAAPKTGRTA